MSVCLTTIKRMILPKRTYWFAFILMFAFFMHFAFTLLYQLPVNESEVPLKRIAYRYSVPFFHQTWKLFAPDVPEYDVQMHYSVHLTDGWSGWEDAAMSAGWGAGSVVETLEQSMASGLTWDVARNVYYRNDSVQFDRVMNGFAFGRSVYFLHGLCKRVPHLQNADSVRIQLQYRFTPLPCDTCKFTFRTVEFPPYPFPKSELP